MTITQAEAAVELARALTKIDKLEQENERLRDDINRHIQCEINPYSSRVCDLGTKGCVLHHDETKQLRQRIAELEAATSQPPAGT